MALLAGVHAESRIVVQPEVQDGRSTAVGARVRSRRPSGATAQAARPRHALDTPQLAQAWPDAAHGTVPPIPTGLEVARKRPAVHRELRRHG